MKDIFHRLAPHTTPGMRESRFLLVYYLVNVDSRSSRRCFKGMFKGVVPMKGCVCEMPAERALVVLPFVTNLCYNKLRLFGSANDLFSMYWVGN